MEMLAVVSSKRTPLTIVLPLVMTPVEMVLPPAPPGGGVVVPVPPVPPPPPQAARMEPAARSAVRDDWINENGKRVSMMLGPSASSRRDRTLSTRAQPNEARLRETDLCQTAVS